METIEKDVKRMEMQIGQLISIIANQNDRLNQMEDLERKKRLNTLHITPLAKHV